MPKFPRRNLNFRQTAREFRSAASAKIYNRIQRFFPYSKYQTKKFWTKVMKKAKIGTKYRPKGPIKFSK